jgi:hypothetical protein
MIREEVLVGPERRRRRSDEEKPKIFEELCKRRGWGTVEVGAVRSV